MFFLYNRKTYPKNSCIGLIICILAVYRNDEFLKHQFYLDANLQLNFNEIVTTMVMKICR